MKQSNWKNNKGKFKGQTGVWESENIDKGKRPSPQQRNTFSTDVVPERAILVSVCDAKSSMERTEECLNELAFLLETAGGVPVKSVIQKLDRPDSRTYIGSGKLEEVVEYKNALDVDFIVFDDELSPAQLRNLEKAFECRILDRTTLILDIFAKRARTSIAKTQVELAQLQYMLPRLTRMWTHLERQRGGIGMRGPGESQIETDRRLITEKITLLKERLRDIDKQKVQQRKNRESLVRVALVGYTNVGKSTLMNLLSKSDVFAENKLFATLDEIGAADKPTIMVFNKVDAYTFEKKDEDDLTPMTKKNWTLEMLQNSWLAKENAQPTVFISAAKRENIESLRTMMYDEIKRIHAVRYPYNNFLW